MLLFVQLFALRSLNYCKHDMDETSKVHPPLFGRHVRCSAHGYSFMRLWYILDSAYLFHCATVNTIFSSHYAVPTLTVTLITNITRFPNVAPYNTLTLNCTATSRVEGVGPVALPKRFQWRRRYGPDTTGLMLLSSNTTIQIQDGDNLTQPTSSSMLTVTEDIPGDYRYRCWVDLELSADNIFSFTDVYPITVTGMWLSIILLRVVNFVWCCICTSCSSFCIHKRMPCHRYFRGFFRWAW